MILERRTDKSEVKYADDIRDITKGIVIVYSNDVPKGYIYTIDDYWYLDNSIGHDAVFCESTLYELLKAIEDKFEKVKYDLIKFE